MASLRVLLTAAGQPIPSRFRAVQAPTDTCSPLMDQRDDPGHTGSNSYYQQQLRRRPECYQQVISFDDAGSDKLLLWDDESKARYLTLGKLSRLRLQP